jgi:hypothetical protein
MDDLVAAMKSVTTTLEAIKLTVDNSQSLIKDLVAWKPQLHGAMQEVCTDINNATNSPDGAVPAKCSMLGLSPNAVEEMGVDQQLADCCDNATSSTDGAVPAKCSMPGFSLHVWGIEVVFSSLQLGIVSTVSSPPLDDLLSPPR